jgi:hypothetical protein
MVRLFNPGKKLGGIRRLQRFNYPTKRVNPVRRRRAIRQPHFAEQRPDRCGVVPAAFETGFQQLQIAIGC